PASGRAPQGSDRRDERGAAALRATGGRRLGRPCERADRGPALMSETASDPPIRIQGPGLLLRPLTPAEIDDEWREMLAADPMTIVALPDEAAFKARLGRTGHLEDGWLDLAIDLDGSCIGRIQTFVPPDRALPPGVFEVGIGLQAHARNRGHGREALALLTDWLFEHAGAVRVEAPTDPANVPMKRVVD